MFKVMVLSAAATFACAAAALHPVQNERLFRLEKNGRISYLLATAHEVFPESLRLPPVSAALRESCRVILQGDLDRKRVITDHQSTREVGQLLSPRQRRTYDKVVGTSPAAALVERWVRPEYAAWLVRNRLAGALMREQARFGAYVDTLSEDERLSLLAQARTNPHLREAVRLLWGGHIPTYYLLARRDQSNTTESGADPVTMAELVEREAQALGLTIRHLEPPVHASATELQLGLHDEKNLRLMLDDLAAKFDEDQDHSRSADMSLAYLIERHAADRFFDGDPVTYGRVQRLLARSLVSHRLFFSGDDQLAQMQANVHVHWKARLKSAVARGGAFIALDIDRVIPGVDPNVKRTVLEMLDADGVSITPLSAHRTTLRLVR